MNVAVSCDGAPPDADDPLSAESVVNERYLVRHSRLGQSVRKLVRAFCPPCPTSGTRYFTEAAVADRIPEAVCSRLPRAAIKLSINVHYAWHHCLLSI